MEQLISGLNFKTVTDETNSKLYDQLESLRRADKIKNADLGKCLQILHKKVAVPDFPSELQNGYYCAMHCFTEIYNEMKWVFENNFM